MPICQGVDPIVQQEPLIVERAQSPFLGLNRIGVIRYDFNVLGVWTVKIRRFQSKSENIRVSCMVRSRLTWGTGAERGVVCCVVSDVKSECRERCSVLRDGEWV